MVRGGQADLLGDGPNLYAFVHNDPIDQSDPLGLSAVFGGNYGNWCGPHRSGPNDPIDEVDAACKRHDYCLAGPKEILNEFLNPCKFLRCNYQFCYDLKYSDCSRAPNPNECRQAKAQIMAVFCPLIVYVVP